MSRCCINFPHELTCQILTNQSIKIGRRAWPTRDYGGKSQKDVKAGWIFASEVSLKSKVQLMNTTYFICILKNWTWAYDHLKSSNLSADTFKKTLELSGSIPEPAIRSGDTGQQKHYFDSCQLIKTWMYNISLQAPKLARKCEIKHWYLWCERTEDRAVAVPSRDCQIDFLSYGASLKIQNWARDQIKHQRKT